MLRLDLHASTTMQGRPDTLHALRLICRATAQAVCTDVRLYGCKAVRLQGCTALGAKHDAAMASLVRASPLHEAAPAVVRTPKLL